MAKFTCEVETTPNVKFQWYKAGREIYDGDKYSIRSSNYLSTLEIPRPQVVDCGEYSCKASNQHGSVSSTAFLTVTGKYRVPSTSFFIQYLKYLDILKWLPWYTRKHLR